MYSLHSDATVDEMRESEVIINDVQVLMSNVHEYLHKLGIESTFRQKSFEDIDIIQGASQLVTIEDTSVPISVSISVSSELVAPPRVDLYRDGRLEINDDHIWFPAYVQINNIFTRGKKFNSFWTSGLFIEDLMKALGTATKQDYEKGIWVQDHLVVFDESKFESNRIDVSY